jgi:pimeloyl-ACP methyl ester carboxylesterase
MAEIELSAGPILYEDSGGEGPVIVLCHGLLMTASLWDEVVEELGPGFRCVRPTLPLGAHRRPMRGLPSIRGSFRSRGRFTVGCVALELVGGGVANDYFLVHASRPVIEALIRTAGRLAPSRGSCRSGVGAA